MILFSPVKDEEGPSESDKCYIDEGLFVNAKFIDPVGLDT